MAPLPAPTARDFLASRLLQTIRVTSAFQTTTRTRRLALAFTLLAALVAAILIAGGTDADARGTQSKAPKKLKRPNIVLIQTDDQSLATLVPEAMPNLFGTLIPR